MYSPNFVDYGRVHRKHEEYASRELAELVARIAQLGISGSVRLPTDEDAIRTLKDRIEERIAAARTRFAELAESRTSDETARDSLVEMCVRWFVLGRKRPKS